MTNIIFHPIENSDYSPIYYSLVTYNKLTSLSKHYLYNKGFEANEIINGIYLGSIDSAFDFDEMKKRNITHIISAIAGFIPGNTTNFTFLIVNALDSENTNLSGCFETTNKFIDNVLANHGNVLIHCMSGRSRSASILAAYLMNRKGLDATNSVALIREKRPVIQPNSSFLKQLFDYEHSCAKVC